jgi:hypothetical protein
MMLPTESWVAKWNQYNLPGIYAVTIIGQDEEYNEYDRDGSEEDNPENDGEFIAPSDQSY